jgi:hypothetical protein
MPVPSTYAKAESQVRPRSRAAACSARNADVDHLLGQVERATLPLS